MTKKTLALAALMAFCMIILTKATPTPSEKELVELVTKTTEKDWDDYDDDRKAQMTKLTYAIAQDMAARDKDFAKDVDLEPDRYKGRLDLVDLDQNNVLLVLTTYQGPYQDSGCLFLVNKQKGELKPLKLNQVRDTTLEKTYGIITGFNEGGTVSFSTPILNIYSRASGLWAGIGDSDSYVLKDGTLQHIRTHATKLDEEKWKTADTSNENLNMENYVYEEISFWNKDISKLYKRVTSKNPSDLKNSKSWKPIYFVKSEKAHFHNKPEIEAKQKAYIVNGDAIYVSETKGAWVFAHYLDVKSNKTASGWIKGEDVMKLDRDT